MNGSWFSRYRPILVAALVIRLVAVIFSQGYGMHDDHFLIVESSASWVDGYDYNNWLPWSEGNQGHPEGHSFTYVGLNYLFFKTLSFTGLENPKVLMFLNRLVHALLSMLVVIYGMKITERLSDQKSAKIVGWMLALLWILPFLSVRNLVETAAIPIMMPAFWLVVRNKGVRDFLWAGILLGLAVSFRYQIGVFAIGMAAVFFFSAKWKEFALFCTGVLLVFGISQGVVDWLIWGYPFAELLAYITYNMNEGTGYLPNHNYFMYIYVLAGSLLFPMGLVLMVGFARSWKKYIILFVPVTLFVVFHTVYPNRQERFVLTVLPFFIMAGVMGYALFRDSVTKEKIWRISWIAFWVLNIPMLLFASTMYSKKSRVEAMYALYGNGQSNEVILLEGSASGRVSMMPKFYAKSWHCHFLDYTEPSYPSPYTEQTHLDYIFFFDEANLLDRIKKYKEVYPQMELVKKCDPSTLDVLLRTMNPRNANEYIEVWKTNQPLAGHQNH